MLKIRVEVLTAERSAGALAGTQIYTVDEEITHLLHVFTKEISIILGVAPSERNRLAGGFSGYIDRGPLSKNVIPGLWKKAFDKTLNSADPFTLEDDVHFKNTLVAIANAISEIRRDHLEPSIKDIDNLDPDYFDHI
jgi:hypothetical protein